MRQNPGKLLFLFLLLPLLLFAGDVRVSVDKRRVVKGDTVTVTIEADGSEVKFPVIRQIDGFPILGTSQQSNIAIINGNVRRTTVKRLTFAPMHSVTVPSFTVSVDGKEVKTQPLKIEVTDAPPATQGKAGSGPFLQIHLNKTHVHVGEPVEMEVVLHYPAGKNVVQTRFQKPEFENIWIKQLGDTVREVRGDEVIEKQRYLIFPQKAGRFELGPLTAKIAKRVMVKPPINDPFFNDDFFNDFFARLQWNRVASNRVTLIADPLPGGVDLYGSFTLHAGVDRRKVEAGKPVTLTITVEGEGNIEDVDKFDIDIPSAVVYSDDPVVKEWVRNGRYGGRFVQKVTIVADNNYTVPSVTLRYFDRDKKRVVEKRTAPIPIEVVGGKAPTVQARQSQPAAGGGPGETKEPESEAPAIVKREGVPYGWLILAMLLGIALGAGGMAAWNKGRKLLREAKVRKEADVARAIRKAKSDRQLFDLLLPYAKEDPEIEAALQQLEANLYQNAHNKIDKALMAQIVEELEEG
ncbi:BatD family protein [Hydrogenimonas sp. SS33]|uniref:BatD family protein n=1 Tax=Hydrogenimonas leucolamina TaxID=2954236 RepID=UPI00336C143F